MMTAKYFKYDEEYNLIPIYNDDVVEVVRCENCKHWVTTPGELIAPYCEKIGIKDDNGYRDFDDFCSYGERKEKDE